MRLLLMVAGCVLACSAQAAVSCEAAAPAQGEGRPVTDAVRSAVVQAIEDELYDYGREGLFFEIDENPGGDRLPAVLTVYVSKTLSPDGVGVALYDDMPLGQVYRYFSVDQAGMVRLAGSPEGPFRNTGGSVLTVYLKMETVCAFVSGQSTKATFIVDPNVSRERRRLASSRQVERTGFSFWQHRKRR